MDYASLAVKEAQEKRTKKLDEFLNRLKHVTEKEYYPSTHFPMGDREDWHREADNILCELLNYLGYPDFVEAFEEVPKWYA